MNIVLPEEIVDLILSYDKGSFITPCVCKEFYKHTEKYRKSINTISNFYFKFIIQDQESYTKKTLIRKYIIKKYKKVKTFFNIENLIQNQRQLSLIFPSNSTLFIPLFNEPFIYIKNVLNNARCVKKFLYFLSNEEILTIY